MASCTERTRSGLNPGSTFSTDHRLRISRPAPTSRMIASANSVTTRARRIRRVATPPATPLPPSWPEGRKFRRAMVIAGASPTRIPVRRQRPRPSRALADRGSTSFRRARSPGLSARMRRMPARATNNPSSPEMTARVRLSASNCRTIRAGSLRAPLEWRSPVRGWRCEPARGSRRW